MKLSKFVYLNTRIVLRLDTLYKPMYDSKYFSRTALLEFYFFIQNLNFFNDELKTVCFSFCNHQLRKYSTFKRKITKSGKREYELDRIIKALLDDNIIKEIRNYRNFENVKTCRVYGFTEEHAKFRLEALSVNRTTEIFVGDSKFLDDYKDLSKDDEDTKHQLEVMMDKRYTIDVKEAIKVIDSLKDKHGKPYDDRVKMYMEELVYNFNYKTNLYSKRGILVDRIFTTFCAFKKEIRNIIRYNGEYLSNIDLRSTMPYLLFHEYKNENKEFNELYNLIVSDDTDIYNTILEWQKTQHIFVDSITKSKIKNNKVENYIERVQVSKIDRDLIKVHFMRYLYSKSMNCNTIVKNYIKANFPTVHEFLTKKKKDLLNENKSLTSFLTKKEVDIFIHTANSFDNVLSLHDGLYLPKFMKDKVLKKLKERFNELGYSDYKLHIE